MVFGFEVCEQPAKKWFRFTEICQVRVEIFYQKSKMVSYDPVEV